MSGEAVAGVRFKAWQPAAGLHPTIPAHAPLTFDVIDNWNHRSLGRLHTTLPIPAAAIHDTLPRSTRMRPGAGGRRGFQDHGHTGGPGIDLRLRSRVGEFPLTLDLRRRRANWSNA